ncbi:MAG TPA: single-stranded DNA-binding protein [Syntrophorhabdaceae bacterium]|nr:single-stranded DNA-binding protein [Syntrophorhabdaceae bacterium]HPP05903.1 single-stranded DNA-binding protein [Syntrophorhabdaceae bacterium]
MASLNKVFLIGRLGADPEIRSTTDGTTVASFRIATTEIWRDRNNEKQERTEWHTIIAWRRLGEIARDYLKKGRLVYIEGRIQSREYETKDGTKRKVTEIIANDLRLFPQGTPTADEKKEIPQEKAEDVFVPEVEEDDIPL